MAHQPTDDESSDDELPAVLSVHPSTIRNAIVWMRRRRPNNQDDVWLPAQVLRPPAARQTRARLRVCDGHLPVAYARPEDIAAWTDPRSPGWRAAKYLNVDVPSIADRMERAVLLRNVTYTLPAPANPRGDDPNHDEEGGRDGDDDDDDGNDDDDGDPDDEGGEEEDDDETLVIHSDEDDETRLDATERERLQEVRLYTHPAATLASPDATQYLRRVIKQHKAKFQARKIDERRRLASELRFGPLHNHATEVVDALRATFRAECDNYTDFFFAVLVQHAVIYLVRAAHSWCPEKEARAIITKDHYLSPSQVEAACQAARRSARRSPQH